VAETWPRRQVEEQQQEPGSEVAKGSDSWRHDAATKIGEMVKLKCLKITNKLKIRPPFPYFNFEV
jgi:hypothetical protein